jgi:cephalosporin hydroxylase
VDDIVPEGIPAPPFDPLAAAGALEFQKDAREGRSMTMRDRLLDKLFRGADPFESWRNHSGKVADHSYPHTGLPSTLVEESIRAIQARRLALDLIIEVGSFKGGSASVIADVCKKLGLIVPILCIDTFLGDVNMRFDHNGWLDWLSLEGGHPTVFDQFMANITDKGHRDLIIPLVASSLVGLRGLARIGISASLSYLDSAHEEKETALELEALARIINKGGIILGDDFSWPSVRNDVCAFTVDRKLTMRVSSGQYYAIDT